MAKAQGTRHASNQVLKRILSQGSRSTHEKEQWTRERRARESSGSLDHLKYLYLPVPPPQHDTMDRMLVRSGKLGQRNDGLQHIGMTQHECIIDGGR